MCVIGKVNAFHSFCQIPSPSSPRPAMSFLSGAKNLAGRTLEKNRNEIPILLAQNCPPGSTAGLRPPLRMTERGGLFSQSRRRTKGFLREEAPAGAGEGEIVCMYSAEVLKFVTDYAHAMAPTVFARRCAKGASRPSSAKPKLARIHGRLSSKCNTPKCFKRRFPPQAFFRSQVNRQNNIL